MQSTLKTPLKNPWWGRPWSYMIILRIGGWELAVLGSSIEIKPTATLASSLQLSQALLCRPPVCPGPLKKRPGHHDDIEGLQTDLDCVVLSSPCQWPMLLS